MNKVIISQLIPTIQGEGPSVGTPVLLIRMGNCNLDCDFCDTKWSNNLKFGEVKKITSRTFSLPLTIDDTNFDDFIKYIIKEFISHYKINTILLTGGEPFLNKDFIRKLVYNDKLTKIGKIEIETNGVLIDNEEDYKSFDHWLRPIQLNISPKLDPKYYRSKKIKTIEDIIELFKRNSKEFVHRILVDTPTTVNWKFVYDLGGEISIKKFIKEVPDVNSVFIMPLTPDYKNYKTEIEFLEDFRDSSYDAIDFCMQTGYIFTPRAHVFVFNSFKHRNELVDVRKKDIGPICVESKTGPKRKPIITETFAGLLTILKK